MKTLTSKIFDAILGGALIIVIQTANAQAGSCSYQNSECQISDVHYTAEMGSNRGKKFKSGDEACSAAVAEMYPTYQNPKYFVQYPQYGEGCEYDFYYGTAANPVYSHRLFIQGWAQAHMNCPTRSGDPDYHNSPYYYTHNYTGWIDTTDKSNHPAGRLWCVYCRSGTKYNGNGACTTTLDFYRDKPNSCPNFGNPISPLVGSKRQTEVILPGLVSAVYDSRLKVPNLIGVPNFSVAAAPSFGQLWNSSVHKRLVLQRHQLTGAVPAVQASRGGSAWVSFKLNEATGAYVPDVDIKDALARTASGWVYLDRSANSIESYDATGALLTVSNASGALRSYVYSTSESPAGGSPRAGLLIGIRDQNDRVVQFEYSVPASGSPVRVSQIIDVDGAVVMTGYDGSDNLSEIVWPDGTKRQYLYENGSLSWALTGIIDENGSRFSTFSYDAGGRAVSTEHAGGVERYRISFTGYLAWQVSTAGSTATVNWQTHTLYPPTEVNVEQPNGSVTSLKAVSVAGYVFRG